MDSFDRVRAKGNFKQYYLKKYNLKDWGEPGELMVDVYNRVLNTLDEYNREVLKSVNKDLLY